MKLHKSQTQNHLAKETSPYLKQHMYNPVDWYPWSETAFKKAKEENKPIFLSIGYSTCHWCHVMARESFEDEETAEYLNTYFISIKLDREERPDLDQVFQQITQMVGIRGGWPLSIFMTPEKKPFFAGTYFPKERKYGMLSFIEVLEKIVKLYTTRRYDVEHTGNQIQNTLVSLSAKSSVFGENSVTKDILKLAMVTLEPSFDSLYGGFGSAPKFPNFTILLFIIRQLAEDSDKNLEVYQKIKIDLENTLDKMASGGIYDHVGGGFARYSVDAQWMIPHFEKMLYDNALALQVYSEAYFLFQKPRYKEIVRETVDWVLRDMYHENTGFYSALDADSEGEEGKYYVWDKNELTQIIPKEKQNLFFQAYGITEKGNFENNTNHLYLKNEHITKTQKTNFKSILNLLLKIREKRVSPSLDNKILTSWSSLMVKGLYSAYKVLQDSAIREIAHTVIESLRKFMYSAKENILYRVLDAETNHRKVVGHLDDYAYFIQALFDDFQFYPDPTTLVLINQLIEDANIQFWDKKYGGFFYSNILNTDLVTRIKIGSDMSLPNPNSVMAENLLRYHYYLADPENTAYLKRAENALIPFIENAYSSPTAFGAILLAVQWYLYGSIDLIITDRTKTESEIFQLLHSYYIPRLHLWYKEEIPPMLNALKNKFELNSKYSFYFCIYFNCLPPTSNWDAFINQLDRQLLKIK